MSNEEARKRTQETAKRLFAGGAKLDPPYLLWREFDRDLANDFSMFITGNLYSPNGIDPAGKADGCLRNACCPAGRG